MILYEGYFYKVVFFTIFQLEKWTKKYQIIYAGGTSRQEALMKLELEKSNLASLRYQKAASDQQIIQQPEKRQRSFAMPLYRCYPRHT